MKMASTQPEDIVVDAEVGTHEIGEDGGKANAPQGSVSPDGVADLESSNDAVNKNNDEVQCELDDESDSESEDEEDEDEPKEEETNLDELDGAALLALTKSRLEKTPQPTPAAQPTEVNDNESATSDNENDDDVSCDNDETEHATNTSTVGDSHAAVAEEKKSDGDITGAPAPIKDQAYYLELAIKKSKEAGLKANQDDEEYLHQLSEEKVAAAKAKAISDDPEYLHKLAEEKVAMANAKAAADEAEMGEVIKPAVEAKQTRSENSELWALLNYSKMRLETGSTPQVGGGKSKSGSKPGSVRGDDMSISSKLSKSSKRSLGSRKASLQVVGGPGNLASPGGEGETATDAPFPNVTGNDDESVDGSVSLESGTKNSLANDEDDESDNSDEDESSDEESEEEEELPDFLKDTEEAIDAEEARAMYEAAKFKAASILSVSEDKLTDVQMLQAIAIAEEAARKGDDKFSTKRSLFKLNEAKVEDLKAFLNFSSSPKDNNDDTTTANNGQEGEEAVGWGIGRGRLFKKLGAVAKDFRQKCNEIDEKMQQERVGQPTHKEMFTCAMSDLKAQIDEYEKIVASQKESLKKGSTKP